MVPVLVKPFLFKVDYNLVPKTCSGISVFTDIVERTREGNDLYWEAESGVIEKTAMVFRSNERTDPWARMRVALTGLTIAGILP